LYRASSDQRRDQMAEIDLAGWKRYQMAPYAASYRVDLKAEQHLFKDAVVKACG